MVQIRQSYPVIIFCHKLKLVLKFMNFKVKYVMHHYFKPCCLSCIQRTPAPYKIEGGKQCCAC